MPVLIKEINITCIAGNVNTLSAQNITGMDSKLAGPLKKGKIQKYKIM